MPNRNIARHHGPRRCGILTESFVSLEPIQVTLTELMVVGLKSPFLQEGGCNVVGFKLFFIIYRECK